MLIKFKGSHYEIKCFATVDFRILYIMKLEVYCGTQPPAPMRINNEPHEVAKIKIRNLKKAAKLC